MNDAVTIQLFEQATAEVKIPIKIPPRIDGFFYGDAIIRSKDEMKKLSEELKDMGERAEDGADDGFDEALVRKLYTGFRGLGGPNKEPITGEEAIREVVAGRFSSYLMGAAVTAYFQQYGAALQQNLPKRRWR